MMARRLVALGIKVVPGFCNSDGNKVPLAGGDWSKLATRSDEKLVEWWTARPWAWVGVVSGPGSCLVVDCDAPSGVAAFREVVQNCGEWSNGEIFCYKTPGRLGGLHVISKWPNWLEENFTQAKWYVEGGEVQIRGSGHFTLFGGTKRPDLRMAENKDYEFLSTPEEELGELAESVIRTVLMESLVSHGRGSGYGSEMQALSIEEAEEQGIWEDGRKNGLAGVCWYYAIRGCSVDIVLERANQFSRICSPELSESLIEAKAKYAFSRAEAAFARERENAMKMLNLWKRGAAHAPS